MNNNNSMIFYQDDGQQSKERADQVLILQNAYNPYQINGIEQQQMNFYSGYEQNQQIFKDNSLFLLNQNNLLHQYYLSGSGQVGNIVQNEIEQNQPSQCNLYSANFCQAFEEEQYSIQQLRKSEKEIYLDKKLSSKCYYQEQKLIKKRKIETNEEQFQLVQNKTQRELLEEKAVYNGNKINSGEVSYNSYIDGIGINNQRASISQYCQARFIDEKNQFRKKQGQGNITDLIRMNEYNSQNSWGFQRLDEDKKYDWVIEDIFIQNSWSANMGSGKSQMLGKGAFGNVIKVKDNNTQVQYALKFIKKIFFSKAITETEIMKQLSDDKNIIKYYDIYLYDQQMERNQVIEIQQYLVIVMELAQASLEDILKQRIICQAHWTTVELLTIMKQISLALQSLAKKNIVHRDIKPSNILYCLKSQSYKLADFGEAKVVEEINFDYLHSPRGTKRYMSPELLNGLNSIKQANQLANQLLNDSPNNLSNEQINENNKNKELNMVFDKVIELQSQEQNYQNDCIKSENNQKIENSENPNKNNQIIQHNNFDMKKDEEEKNLDANQAQSSQKNKSNSEFKQLNIKTNETREVMYEPYSNDIYSLGLCFYQMKYLDDLSYYNGHKSKTSTTEDYLQSKLQEDDQIDKLISKMISYNPKYRPNINQVLNFIEEQLSKISQELEGMTFNYESSSSSNTIDQNKVTKSINQTQLIDTFAQQGRNIPQSQSELFQEEKVRQPSRQILFNLNNTYENILNDKIVVGSSKYSNQNNKNNSKQHSFSDYEEDESIDDEDEQNEDYEEEDEDEEEQQKKQIEQYQQTNSNQENNIEVGIITKINKQASDQQNQQKNLQQQKKLAKQNKKENITQNLFEECKANEPAEHHKSDFIENKVNELQFLKLIETKNQSNLSITQKIQYMIARAQAYESLLKFQKARDTYQELYEKHFQCLSPFDQINLLKNLGRLDHKMSKFNSSIKFYQQLLELLKQSKDLNDLQISEVYQMLGSAHCFQGDYQAALLYYDESLKKKEMLKDSIEKEEIADLLVYIGLVKKHLQQYQSSLENYQKALEIVNENPEKNLKRISCIKKNMGTVYDHLQNNSQSIQYLESALQDTIQAYGTENERVVNCLNKLGIVLVHSGIHNHEQAIRHFERAIKIMKKLYKMDTINESLRKQFRFKDNPLDEAINPLYTRALQVNEEAYILYRQVYDYYHVGVGIILEIRGMIYHYLQKFSFAVKYYTEALNIYTIILKPEHEFVKRSQAFVNMAKTENKFQNFPKI
ncbi:tyrosine kinase domain protein (macronuclear) [Tetrahymena thermophila SB210]|uniref:non-specific serine/threonine protein kinase n=1 Tax=Tetrahymena thermophila (strain SB210) TaxID=312017 RepID=I7M788_TETTS|nr:tyrosine kinase domain protein [Tetrahymena thermophila SB210]EAR90769.1 tyrosine kinase domain protein [Tetrahymena thermophila SB210]|eukprot:XP_001011014.1 tyrosine kinase domain protein [Tetrahymena thermophila SB210]